MRLVSATFILLLPLAALAQDVTRAASPILVVGDSAAKPAAAAAAASLTPEQMVANYPKQAITEVAAKTGGQTTDVPATPPAPTAPANPASASAPASPANPNSPTPPPNPVNKLWPRDTVEVFLPPCTGLRPAYVIPCTCVITKLMLAMGHDEFLKKSENGTIEQDPRLQQIRLDCVTAVKKKEE